MLPFPKRRSPSQDVVELDDDDLVVLDGEPAPEELARTVNRDAATKRPSGGMPLPRPSLPPASLPPPAFVSSPKTSPSNPRFSRPDERVEDDVAGECLASIAAATRGRAGLVFRTPVRGDVDVDIDVDLGADDELAPDPVRVSGPLPPVSAPPPRASVPWARESRAPGPFARASSAAPSSAAGVVAAPSSRLPLPPSLPSVPSPASLDSVAPLASSPSARPPHEPTVIVVRERPRTAWFVGSAVVGAACAVVAMRLLAVAPFASEPPPAPAVHATEVAQQAPPVVTPLPAAAPLASAAPVTVVKFDDTQGVAIDVAPPASASPSPIAAAALPAAVAAAPKAPAPVVKAPPPPAPKPVVAAAPAPKPTAATSSRLPDGSYGLGGSDNVPATAPAPAPSPAPAAPPAGGTPKKRALTPEQELAEAQLKASMR